MNAPLRAQVDRQVRDFLAQVAPHLAQVIAELSPDARLWEVVDSLGVLELVEYLEECFHIEVEPEEFIPENFESTARIAAFIDQKTS